MWGGPALEVPLHPRELRTWAQCSPLISSVIISSVMENQLCLFTFLGGELSGRPFLLVKLPRGSGSISEDAVDVGNSHSSKTLVPRGYQ